MATRGIDIRQTADRIVFRASLKDADGAKVASGTTELRLLRVEDDGTLDVYDWTTNDFVATGSGTPDDETTMTHRQRRDSSGADVDTGVWTAVLSTLTNFTSGQVYIAQVTNTGAVPESQEREFQFGATEGDQITRSEATSDKNELRAIVSRYNNVLHVGSGQAYATLALAGAAFSVGDLIVVHAGTYVEELLDTNNAVYLLMPGALVGNPATGPIWDYNSVTKVRILGEGTIIQPEDEEILAATQAGANLYLECDTIDRDTSVGPSFTCNQATGNISVKCRRLFVSTGDGDVVVNCQAGRIALEVAEYLAIGVPLVESGGASSVSLIRIGTASISDVNVIDPTSDAGTIVLEGNYLLTNASTNGINVPAGVTVICRNGSVIVPSGRPAFTTASGATLIVEPSFGYNPANISIHGSSTFIKNAKWPLEFIDSGSTAVARTGADSDTLETLSDQIKGLCPVAGTIGSTGNDTTHLHLTGLTYEDNKLVDWMLIFLDVSTDLYYFSPITAWVNSTALATLSDAIPTPQNAVDKYWLIPPSVAKLYISKALFRVDPADHDDTSGWFGQRITGAATEAQLVASIRADLEGGTPIPVDITAIDGDTDAPIRLKASANTMIEGTVNDANFTPTTTQFRVIGPASANPDNYKHRRILITSGALQRQVSSITASSLVSGETHLTLDPALTAAPADGVTIIIV